MIHFAHQTITGALMVAHQHQSEISSLIVCGVLAVISNKITNRPKGYLTGMYQGGR